MDFAEGRLITSSMSFHPRWKLLTNLVRAKIQNKRFIEELKKIEKPIKSAFDERTILVHGVWFMQDEKACVSLTKQKTQKADHVRLHIYERDDLETLANQLAKIGDFLQLLNTDLESNNLS